MIVMASYIHICAAVSGEEEQQTAGERVRGVRQTQIAAERVSESERPTAGERVRPEAEVRPEVETAAVTPTENVEERPHQKSRKRRRDPSTWKSVMRKRLYQEGKEHCNTSQQRVPAKNIKTSKNCKFSCKFNCSKKITDSEREKCFEQYYHLEQDRKYDYLAMTTECQKKERQRIDNGDHDSRRKNSFKYFLEVEGEKIRVCKPFFLGTLSISQKTVYNVHQNKSLTGIPKADARGKHAKKNR